MLQPFRKRSERIWTAHSLPSACDYVRLYFAEVLVINFEREIHGRRSFHAQVPVSLH